MLLSTPGIEGSGLFWLPCAARLPARELGNFRSCGARETAFARFSHLHSIVVLIVSSGRVPVAGILKGMAQQPAGLSRRPGPGMFLKCRLHIAVRLPRPQVSRVEREVVDLLRSMNSGEALPLAQPAPTRFSTQRKSSSGHSRREALSGEAPPGDEAGAAHVGEPPSLGSVSRPACRTLTLLRLWTPVPPVAAAHAGSSAEDLDSSKENLVCSEELSPSDQMPSRLPTQHSMPFTVLRQRQPRRHALSDVTNAEAPSSPFGQRGAGVLLEMARGRGAAQATEAGRGVGNAAGPRPMERWGAKRPRSTDTVLSEEDDTAPSPHDTAARVAATTGPPSVAPPASLRDTAASPMRPRVAGPSGGGSKMTPKTQWRRGCNERAARFG